MFTGIIETTGKIVSIDENGSNLLLFIESPLLNELRIDQSIAHNGVCLTVDQISESNYRVTAIDETLNKTNFRSLKVGDIINIERSMPAMGRLDGHIIQGHVDGTVKCLSVEEMNGSHIFSFRYEPSLDSIIIKKGSVCLNGVSLTIADVSDDHFSVAIIPYTFTHTNFHSIKAGDSVNIEFDIIGKYITKIAERYFQAKG